MIFVLCINLRIYNCKNKYRKCLYLKERKIIKMTYGFLFNFETYFEIWRMVSTVNHAEHSETKEKDKYITTCKLQIIEWFLKVHEVNRSHKINT